MVLQSLGSGVIVASAGPRLGSIVQIARIEVSGFNVSIKELAEWFGFEIARIAVDACLANSIRFP